MPNLMTPSYEILSYPEDAALRIERAARTCYKSEDKITPGSAERFVRYLIKRGHMAMIEFGGGIVVRFVSNRGFTHEMVRHRMASFAQESTRYCNYSKDQFGNEISVSPVPDRWLNLEEEYDVLVAQDAIAHTQLTSQRCYMELITLGVPPEIAREVLPIGLKAEIVVKANVREWRHIFGQRCSAKAHPRMRELMVPLLSDLKEKVPAVFDDVVAS